MRNNMFAEHQIALRNQYPHYANWEIEMMGSSVTQLTELPHGVSRRVGELNDEMHLDTAVESAVKESSIDCEAPDGYLFARLSSKGKPSVLVTLKT